MLTTKFPDLKLPRAYIVKTPQGKKVFIDEAQTKVKEVVVRLPLFDVKGKHAPLLNVPAPIPTPNEQM